MSSKDAYRSSAGREAHCRLACIRVVIVFPFGCRGRGGPQRRAPAPARGRAGAACSEAADGLSDKLMALRLGHALQAFGDGEGSVSEAPFRDHSRDPLLLARQSMALQVSGCGTQQPEHVRIIVHGSRPEMLGSGGLTST